MGIDTNVLVFADDPGHPNHHTARQLLEQVIVGKFPGCVSQQILAEYYAVITRKRGITHPLMVAEAKNRVLFLNRSRKLKKVYPKRSTLRRCVEFCAEQNIRGVQIFDAVYAMTLLDNGVKNLVTENIKDFRPFQKLGLRLENPFGHRADLSAF